MQDWRQSTQPADVPARGGLTHLEGTLASRDGTELYTRLVRPPQPLAVVGIVHGYGDHSGCYVELMERLAAAGFESHAVDFRGHGRSGGRRGFARRWSDFLDDLETFVARLRRAAGGQLHAEAQPLFLLGQSHGALLLVHAALHGLADIRGMVFTSPYLRFTLPVPPWKLSFGRLIASVAPGFPMPTDIRVEMLTADPAILELARSDPLSLRIVTPGWFFAAQRAQTEALARAPDFRVPLLVVQGGRDPITDPAATEAFYNRLGSEDKTYRCFPDMRHETLREVGRREVGETIVEWLRSRC
jgi:alpha-beta hydrolase superfamily lysophospholipase